MFRSPKILQLGLTALLTVVPASPAVAAQPMCHGREATITGTAEHDELRGTSGRDVIVGLGGDDHIDAVGGNDIVCGGTGRDYVKGGRCNDIVDGGADADHSLLTPIDVGHGTTVTTLGGVLGGDGDDHVLGGGGPDALQGGAGDDVVSGRRSTDHAAGRTGADVMPGGGDHDATRTSSPSGWRGRHRKWLRRGGATPVD